MTFREFCRKLVRLGSIGSISLFIGANLISGVFSFYITPVAYVLIGIAFVLVGLCTSCAYFKLRPTSEWFGFTSERSMLLSWVIFGVLNLSSIALGCCMLILPSTTVAVISSMAIVSTLFAVSVGMVLIAFVECIGAWISRENVNPASSAIMRNLKNAFEVAETLTEKGRKEKVPLLSADEIAEYQEFLKTLPDESIEYEQKSGYLKDCECCITFEPYTHNLLEKTIPITFKEDGHEFTYSYRGLERQFEMGNFTNAITRKSFDTTIQFTYGVSETVRQAIANIRADLEWARSRNACISSPNLSGAEHKLAPLVAGLSFAFAESALGSASSVAALPYRNKPDAHDIESKPTHADESTPLLAPSLN